MLGIFRRKLEAGGLDATVVNRPIVDFLREDDHKYDLIVFSSCLHHFADIDEVFELCRWRLKLRGIVFSIFDPTLTRRLGSVSRLLISLDYLLFKILRQTRDLPASVARRIRRTLRGGSPDPRFSDDDVGVIAEFRVGEGIDDEGLLERLEAAGFERVSHRRYCDARFDLIRRLLDAVGRPNCFKMSLRVAVQR